MLGQTRGPTYSPTVEGETRKPTRSPTRVGETRSPAFEDNDEPTEAPTEFDEETFGNGTDPDPNLGEVGGDEALYLGAAGAAVVVAGAAIFAMKKSRGQGAEYSYRNESYRAGSIKTAKPVPENENTATYEPSPDVEKLGVATYASSRSNMPKSGRMSGRMSGRTMTGVSTMSSALTSSTSTISSARSALSRATTAMTARSISSQSVVSDNPSFGRESDYSSASGSMGGSTYGSTIEEESEDDEDDLSSMQ